MGRAPSWCLGIVAVCAAVTAACTAPQDPPRVEEARGETPERAPFPLEVTAADTPGASELERVVAEGRAQVEAFFGAPFPEPVRVLVQPDRAAFDASFPPEWGVGQTQCWMVAYGVADRLSLLSPRVWRAEACEHDPDDAVHVQRLVTHELVHAYHGQHNPTRDFSGIEEATGWFAEGLAVLASGQLDAERLAGARRAVAEGRGPTDLRTAWSGADRYGVCGSLVAFLETRCGREGLVRLLAATDFEAFLQEAGLTEEAWLAAWRGWLVEAEAPSGPETGAACSGEHRSS